MWPSAFHTHFHPHKGMVSAHRYIHTSRYIFMGTLSCTTATNTHTHTHTHTHTCTYNHPLPVILSNSPSNVGQCDICAVKPRHVVPFDCTDREGVRNMTHAVCYVG